MKKEVLVIAIDNDNWSPQTHNSYLFNVSYFYCIFTFSGDQYSLLKDSGKNNDAILACKKRGTRKNIYYLSPEVVGTFIKNPQGNCGTERCCWARGLTIWKGRCQRLCRHGKKATGVAGRGGSGYRGVDRGRGHQRTPKTWRHKVKKSLESEKPSAPPLFQGPLWHWPERWRLWGWVYRVLEHCISWEGPLFQIYNGEKNPLHWPLLVRWLQYRVSG